MTKLTGFDQIMAYQEKKKESIAASGEQKKFYEAKKKLAELEKDVPKKLSLSPDDEAKVRFISEVPHVSWRVNAYAIHQGYKFFKTEDEATDFITANNIKNNYGKLIRPQPTISFNVVLEDLKLGAQKRAWFDADAKRPSPEDFIEKRKGTQHVIQFTGDDCVTVMNKHAKKPLSSRSWFYHRQGEGTSTRYSLEDDDDKTKMPAAYKKIELYDLEAWVFPPDPEGLRTLIQKHESEAFRSKASESAEKEVSKAVAWG